MVEENSDRPVPPIKRNFKSFVEDNRALLSVSSGVSVPRLDLSKVQSNIPESNLVLKKYRYMNIKYSKNAPKSI